MNHVTALANRRRGRDWPRRDLAVPALVLALQVAGTLGEQDHHPLAQLGVAGWLLLAVGPLALTVRRSHPVAALWVALAATAPPFSSSAANLSLVVAFFGAATSGHRRAAWTATVAGYVIAVWLGPLAFGRPRSSLEFALLLAGWLAVMVTAAEAIRLRSERRTVTRAAQELDERRRASEERLRMARDLHDVIGHNISLISVQAAVGLDLMDSDPDQARAALSAIKTVSREALDELRSMLAALRQTGEQAPTAPTPGLARLPELAQLTRAAGLPVRIEVSGPVRTLPAAVDLAAYRIVQESLTNVARHAGPGVATVRLGYRADGVSVEVSDNGRGIPGGRLASGTASGAGNGTGRGTGSGTGRGTGSGIAGMTERAAALGGHLTAGPRAGGGFVVSAWLPAPTGTGTADTGMAGTGTAGAAPSRSRAGRDRDGERTVIRVLIVDDQALVRAGFRALLSARADIEVAGEATDGTEAVAQARALRPDVVLMDIRMPGLDGLSATRQITADPQLTGVRILILTTFELDEYLFDALRHGASGFLVKDTEPGDLVTAVRAVAAGDALISPGMTRRLVAEFAARAKEPTTTADLAALTDREREVMALVAEGLTNDEIAGRLFLSPATARTHVSRAMIKLGARDRTQLVVLAYESGLVRPGWLRLTRLTGPGTCGAAGPSPQARRLRSARASQLGPVVVRRDRTVRSRRGGAERGLGHPDPGPLPHRYRAGLQHVRVLHHRVQPAGRGDRAAAGHPAGPVLAGVRHVPDDRAGGHHRHRRGLPRGPGGPADPGRAAPAGQPAGPYGGAGADRARLAAGRAPRPDHGPGGLAGPGVPGGLAGLHADPGRDHRLVPVPVHRCDPARLRQDRSELLLGLAAVPRPGRGRGRPRRPAAGTESLMAFAAGRIGAHQPPSRSCSAWV